MDLFETPLETLVTIHPSFDFLTSVRSFWTWVAVLTAALSLWRIRASSGSQSSQTKWTADDKHLHPTSDPVTVPACRIQTSVGNSGSIPSTRKPLNFTLTEPAREENPSKDTVASSSGTEDCSWGRTAGYCNGISDGKFSVCFEDDGVGERDLAYWESWVHGAIDDVKPVYSIRKVYGGWERMPVPSRLDCNWYSHLDLTLLNGSVVRLWNGAGWRKPPESNFWRFAEDF